MANLQISPQVLGALSNFGASDRIGDAIETRMLRDAEQKKELQRIQDIAAISGAGTAGQQAAQNFDLGGLNSQIKSLQDRLSVTNDEQAAIAITKQIGSLQSLIPETRKGAARNSINALEVARQNPDLTPEQKRNIERVMERVARESGNNTAGIIGRTDGEIEAQKARDEARIRENFFAIPKENRAAYLKGAEERGFGEIAYILDTEEIKRESAQIAIDAARDEAALARTPLPTSGLRERANNLPDTIAGEENEEKADLLARIDLIEERNISEGGTFMPGQRDMLHAELTRINDGITAAAGRGASSRLVFERQIEGQIRTLKAARAKVTATNAEVEELAREMKKNQKGAFMRKGYKSFEAEARRQLEEEKIGRINDEIRGLEAQLGGDRKSSADTVNQDGYTEAQEAKIKANMDANPSKTRAQVIAALNSAGEL
jgi:hypothetical protein